MKSIFTVLITVFLLPLGISADVARTYNLGEATSNGADKTYNLEGTASTGIASSVAIDLISHGTDSTGVWLATGKGVGFSYDGGQSWFVYNNLNGLPSSENLSALYSSGGRIWVAGNKNELIGNELFSLSDGISYSDDNGLSWTKIDFSASGQNIARVIGGDRTVFDIAGHIDNSFHSNRTTGGDVDWLFFTAFAGGLLASQDGGINWRRIWPSAADSADFDQSSQAPALRNLYFSCVTDTSHSDTLFLWAGTAGGIFQYGYVPPKDKYFVRSVKAIAICDTCSDSTNGWLVAGGTEGLSLASSGSFKFFSKFENDGLAGQMITASKYIGGRLLVGTSDTLGSSTGLMISNDQGNSFSPISLPLPGASGVDNQIKEFETIANRVYMAVQNSGLFVSPDSGINWSHILIDSINTASAINKIHSISSLADTLYVGTDSGLATLYMDPIGNISSILYDEIRETDSSSSRLITVAPQNFTDSTGFQDSVIIWTVNEPLTANGARAIGRKGDNGLWTFWQEGANNYDIGFFKDTVFVVGTKGVGITTQGGHPILGEPSGKFPVRQFVNDTTIVGSFDFDTVKVMEVKGDTVIFGSTNGIAISTDRGKKFTILRPSSDSLRADFVINHNFFSSVFGLSGDFVPAMGLQYMSGGTARIWASARPTDFGDPGLSVGIFDTASGQLVWNTVYTPNFAWNFEFDGDSIVYAATDDGLIVTYGKPDSLNTVWDTIPLVNGNTGEVLVEPGVPVYGVEIIDSFIWVGTDDGTVRIDRYNINNQQLFTYVDSTTPAEEVYAFPVPFSPGREQTVDFRYEVGSDGEVTLEVYDFAMNLVARPIDNIFHTAGLYPSGSSQGYTWDGHNGKGDLVAVGVYYFKVTLPSGESKWGKLAVIP